MIVTNPQQIFGNWRCGYALDVHTTGSDYLGDGGFDTQRSELGEGVYRLKYQSDTTVATDIIATAVEFLKSQRTKYDLIIPVPPSGEREVQPVILLAQDIGAALELKVADCVKLTRPAAQLKNVHSLKQRKQMLADLHTVDAEQTSGRDILLFDDLFRSGATMKAVTAVLIGEGRAASVDVLTITRTRAKK